MLGFTAHHVMLVCSRGISPATASRDTRREGISVHLLHGGRDRAVPNPSHRSRGARVPTRPEFFVFSPFEFPNRPFPLYRPGLRLTRSRDATSTWDPLKKHRGFRQLEHVFWVAIDVDYVIIYNQLKDVSQF